MTGSGAAKTRYISKLCKANDQSKCRGLGVKRTGAETGPSRGGSRATRHGFVVRRALATRRLRFAARYGSFLGVGGLLLSLAPVLLRLDETIGLGMLFAARGAVPAPVDVVLVNISRDSAEGVGQTAELDEWPRALHASLIDTLSAAGAAGIVFDIMFEEPRADDAVFAAAIAAAGNVILRGARRHRTSRERRRRRHHSLAAHGAAQRRGVGDGAVHASRGADPGESVLDVRSGADVPSLPVSALQVFLLPYYEEFIALLGSSSPALLDEIPTSRAEVAATRDFGAAMRRIRIEFQRDPELAPTLHAKLRRQPHGPALGRVAPPGRLYDGSDSRYLNYYGPPQTIQTIPYDVARDAPPEKLAVAGKMVFVGFAELRQSEQDDDFFSVFSQSSGDNLSGAEIGASAFANLLGETFVVPLTMPMHLLLVLGWGFLLGAVVIGSSTRMALGLAASRGRALRGGRLLEFRAARIVDSRSRPAFYPSTRCRAPCGVPELPATDEPSGTRPGCARLLRPAPPSSPGWLSRA